MAAVYLAASFPGAFTKEGLILGNPEAVANIDSGDIPAGSWSVAPELALTTPCYKNRLLSVVSDREIEVLQLTENETTSSYAGEPMTVPAPSSGQTSYSCYLHPATVGVYVRTP